MSGISLTLGPEPECEILVFMRSVGPAPRLGGRNGISDFRQGAATCKLSLELSLRPTCQSD